MRKTGYDYEFPMFMGMNRCCSNSRHHRARVPHVHGDEPVLGKRMVAEMDEFPMFMGMNRR